MTETKDVWKVLLQIRDAANNRFPCQDHLKVGAYFVGQRRRKKSGASPKDENRSLLDADWSANLHAVLLDNEHEALNASVRDAAARSDIETVLKLTVIGHLAVFLRVLPSELCADTPINLSRWEINSIASAVNYSMGFDFNGSWEPTAGDFLHLFEMQYELRVARDKREAARRAEEAARTS